jgi:hypothetical protein
MRRACMYAVMCMHAIWSFQKTNVSADAKLQPLALLSIVYRMSSFMVIDMEPWYRLVLSNLIFYNC